MYTRIRYSIPELLLFKTTSEQFFGYIMARTIMKGKFKQWRSTILRI